MLRFYKKSFKTKKLLSLFLACLFSLSSAGICSAQEVYPITDQELTTLNQIFDQLQTNNQTLLDELTASNQDLTTVQQQLETYQEKLEQCQEELATVQQQLAQSKSDLTIVRQDLTETQTLLSKANLSLTQYKKEVQSEQTKLKIQRDIGYVLAAVIAFRK